MKYHLLLIAILFFVCSANSQEFKFETETINYGKIKKGTDGNKVFTFTNVGNAPLIIDDIITSCDCTAPKKPDAPIMPGAKGKITISYDTNVKGGFSKRIIITSNAKTPRKIIRIRGYVE